MALPPGHPRAFGQGRYEVRDLLGAGGTASVYRVWDGTLQVERALKVLRVADRGMSQRLAAEARTMARLDHPNVLRVIDVGEDQGRPYLVMELAPGGTLADRCATEPLPGRAAIDWTLQILAGLAAAHAIGVVHRDVKPSNVLLDERGAARLADFGIALHAGAPRDRSTRTGMALGTLAYMAPEQRLDARSVSVAADLYAVGATLYALLTLRNPMDLFVVQPGDPRLDGLPEPVLAPILRATRYRPEDRYASAAEMARDLVAAREHVADVPLVAPPPEWDLPEPADAVRTPPPAARRPPPDLTHGAITMLTGTLQPEPIVGPTIVAPLEPAPASSSPSRRRLGLLLLAAVLGALLVVLWRSMSPTQPSLSTDPPSLSTDPPSLSTEPPSTDPPPLSTEPPPPLSTEPSPAPRVASAPRPAPSPPAPSPSAAAFPAGAWTGVLDGRPVDVELSGPPEALRATVTAWFSEADRDAGSTHRRARALTGTYDAAGGTLRLEDADRGPGRGAIDATLEGGVFRGAFVAFSGEHRTEFEIRPR